MPPVITKDDVQTDEVVVVESEGETDEVQLGVDVEASYEGLKKVDEAMVDVAIKSHWNTHQ